ncbi:SDR family oxidoreductase [Pedobacter deserti]|uniref:SDR family oxidoreductase n=1 Tax=Pedobacter deserti TaxID=2817382 RepID=UPI00210C1C8C|nr:SDR family oxidoreductase [Pedobacter sp. SYSU D00382]
MNAIITGATKGMGKAIAIKLAENGYNLAVCARNREELAEFAEAMAYTGRDIFTFQADCSIKEELYAFCEAASAHMPTVDVLVNNAGMFLVGAMLDEADEQLEKQVSLNVMAAYYTSKYFGKRMREQASGHIFNICSVASKQIVENAGSYSVTKGALLSLNHVFRDELSKYNVKVTAVLPGSTLTASWEGTDIPFERFVQAEDIAETILYALKMSSGANVDEITIRPVQF